MKVINLFYIISILFILYMWMQLRMISGAIAPGQFRKVCYLSGGKFMIMRLPDSVVYGCGVIE